MIELATFVAAPAAAGIMADWGAEVIKVEPPGGDPLRWLRADGPDGCSPAFETINRGKLCVELDLSSSPGREAIGRLIGSADVFITNVRPAGLERAGLDWSRLHASHPELVYASVTGYGLSGPDANTPAFDNAAFWARSGMADVTRPADSAPFSLRQGSGDQTCALATALGIVTALLARTRGMGGRLVEASLLRTATFVMASDFSNFIRRGSVVSTQPRTRAVNPLNNFFKTSEGRWFFCMPRNSTDDWNRICAVAGLEVLIDDPRFSTPDAQAANSALLVEQLDCAFGQMAFADVASRLAAADIVWSPVQNMAEILADPQADAAGCFVDVDDRAGASFRSSAPPVRFNGERAERLRPVAALGQDNATVFEKLGLQSPTPVD